MTKIQEYMLTKEYGFVTNKEVTRGQRIGGCRCARRDSWSRKRKVKQYEIKNSKLSSPFRR